MTPHATRMLDLYEFRGHRLVVLQQWHDPFGRPMVGLTLEGDGGPAEGLSEADFLREARPLGAAPPPAA